VVAFGVLTIYAGPVVLDPIFNTFKALPQGEVRADVLELARKAGVDVGEVYEIDASRRTTAANAYVTGLGHTKRVVLYDTLVENFSRDELRLVVAHELGHVRYDDVRNGLLYLAIVAPFGMFAVARLTGRLAPGSAAGTPAMLPALALSATVLATTITTISNQYSRAIEARADAFALQSTGEAKPFISFERGIALRNLSDPDPPDWLTFLVATHPPAIERIGLGVAYERASQAP
jgi:STE24 endopeptidase